MGECDFVTEIAAALPLQIICDMMGIPRGDQAHLRAHEHILGVGDPEYVQTMEELMAAGMELFQYGLAPRRRPSPTRATTSRPRSWRRRSRTRRRAPAHASELGSFFLLLVVAGNETTRNAISHGMLALTRHPRPARLWEADFDGVAPTAVEEIVRWATPVIHFRRTATRDTESAARTSRPATRS